jgi:hypothetical protein
MIPFFRGKMLRQRVINSWLAEGMSHPTAHRRGVRLQKKVALSHNDVKTSKLEKVVISAPQIELQS